MVRSSKYFSKRSTAVLFCITIGSTAGWSQDLTNFLLPTEPASVRDYNLNGSVKSLASFQYEVAVGDSGEILGDWVHSAQNFEAEFNREGQMLQHRIYYSDTVIDTYRYTWNSSGNLSKSTFEQLDTIRETVQISWNASKLPTRIQYFDQSGTLFRKIDQQFGGHRELIQQTEFNQLQMAARALFEYHADQRLRSMQQRNQEDELVVEYRYEYTPFGQPQQMMVYDTYGFLVNRTEYFYDTLQRSTEEIVYDAQGAQIQRVTKKYHRNTDKTVEYMVIGAHPNRVIHSEVSRYNDRGDCIATKQSSLHHGPSAWTYEYQYDDMDNWVEKRHYKQGLLFYKTIRSITYYP